MKKDNIITAGGYVTPQNSKTPNVIILRQPKRFNIDIEDFTQSMRAAESIDFPRRYKLFDLYTDILTDSHLSSVIEKRRAAVTEADYAFLKDDGSVDDDMAEQINSPWFNRLVGDILDTKFYGFSLFQFRKENGWIDYDLVPRKNVDPVRRLILRNQTDISGFDWEEFSDLLFIGAPRNLGILFKAAPWVIYKRNDIADWAQFAEIFGMPTREYIYDSDDDDARRQAIEDSENSGSLASFIHAKDTEFNLVDSGTKTASADLYQKLAEQCNKEISKLILGNTLTTEASATGTQALGTVHKKEEDKQGRADRKYVLSVLNYNMSDIFAALGINTAGGKFACPEPKDTDLNTKAAILTQLRTNFNLPVSDDWIYDTFGIDKPDNYDELKKQQEDERIEKEKQAKLAMTAQKGNDGDDDDDDDDDKKNKPDPSGKQKSKNISARLRSFFDRAPHDGADLEW